MIRKTVLALLLAATGVSAHAALSAGDIAFTSFNADEDGWSIVAFSNIAANTTIYFNDNEWNGTAFNNTSTSFESAFAWNSGAAIVNAGTVVRFTVIDNNNPTPDVITSSVGALSVASASTNLGLGNSNETIYAYLGSSVSAPTTFLSAITNGDFSANGPLIGTGLTDGTNALRLRTTGSPDYGVYNGPRAGETTFDAYKAKVANIANWTVDTTDGAYATTIPDTTAFSVTAVPEPKNYAMLLAGLGLMGFIARRRSSR